jgi:hypothetical protein
MIAVCTQSSPSRQTKHKQHSTNHQPPQAHMQGPCAGHSSLPAELAHTTPTHRRNSLPRRGISAKTKPASPQLASRPILFVIPLATTSNTCLTAPIRRMSKKRRQEKKREEKNCRKKHPHLPWVHTYIHTFLHSKHCRKMQLLLLFPAALITLLPYALTTGFYRGENCLDMVSVFLSLPGARASLTAGPAGGRRLPLLPSSSSVPAQEDLRKKRSSLFRHPCCSHCLLQAPDAHKVLLV